MLFTVPWKWQDQFSRQHIKCSIQSLNTPAMSAKTSWVVLPIAFGTPEFDEALSLRYQVLREPLGLDYTAEQIVEEADDIHLACFHPQGQICGYASMQAAGEGQWKMRQVAVAPEFQKQGIGQALVAYAETMGQRLQWKAIVLHARETAIPFYEQQGYTITGDPFTEVNIPHRKMFKSL